MLEISSLVVLRLLIESAVGVDVQESFMFMFNHFVFSFVVSALTLERPSGEWSGGSLPPWTVGQISSELNGIACVGGQSALSALEGPWQPLGNALQVAKSPLSFPDFLFLTSYIAERALGGESDIRLQPRCALTVEPQFPHL